MKLYRSLCLFVLTAVFGAGAKAQNPQSATEQQAALEKAKTDSLTAVNYQQLLRAQHIEMPELPPMADDPNRPGNTAPKNGGGPYLDPQGRFYLRSQWGAWTNYDENKVGDVQLPDPLMLKNGNPVTRAEIWWKQRRPEIIHDYETEIFGRIPENTPTPVFEINNVDSQALDGIAIKKTITGYIDHSSYPSALPVINMLLYYPKNSAGPLPLMVIVAANTRGDSLIIKLLINTGWAVAIFDTYSLQADNGAGLNQGIIGLMGKGRARNPEDWGVIKAWSWGLGKAMDYFQTDKSINPKQIGIEGHSRWGKTALLTAANDSRWAIVFASCSGSMGASLEKRNYGENLGIIAGRTEYHWMAPNFVKYGGNWKAMPVDAHDMISLIAPRPLFITGGSEDLWADPKGEFEACVAASPVYALLGKKGITASRLPAPDISLVDGDLAFREHAGGHTDTIDWPVFIQFAKKYFTRP